MRTNRHTYCFRLSRKQGTGREPGLAFFEVRSEDIHGSPIPVPARNYPTPPRLSSRSVSNEIYLSLYAVNMRLVKRNINRDGSGSVVLRPEEPEDMVSFNYSHF